MRNAYGVVVLVLAAALAASGCATVTVSTDWDREADFAAYATFDFIPDPATRNQLMRDRVESAIARQLEAKGLRRVAARPDLLVSVHSHVGKETQIDTTRLGYRPGRWGYWGAGTATTTVRQVPVGTLIVDLVDGSEQKLVWQGVASDTLDARATPAERDEKVDAAMAKMFAGYPPAPR